MYLYTPFPERRTPRYLAPGWDTALFGCPLTDYVGIAQLLWSSALECAGRFDPSFLDTPDGKQICQVIDRHTILGTLEQHFAIDVPTFRATELKTKEDLAKKRHGLDAALLRRFTFNPLAGRPAVLGFDSWLLCPAPQYIWRKASPMGIYYSGKDHFGTGFPEETGFLFEEYIGRNLRLLRDADVVPEISYRVGRDTRQGVDWIVVFEDLVLLVEVKSTMPTEPVRLGIAGGLDHIARKIGRAYTQINTTAGLIARRHPDFAAIPADRPCQGLVVTLEPFHIANADLPVPKKSSSGSP